MSRLRAWTENAPKIADAEVEVARAEKTVAAARAEIEGIDKEVAAHKAQLDAMAVMVSELNTLRIAAEKLRVTFDIRKTVDEIAVADNELAVCKAQVEKASTVVSDLTTYMTVAAKLNSSSEIRKVYEDIKAVEAQVQSLKSRNGDYDSLVLQQAALSADVDSSRTAVEGLRSEETTLISNLSRLDAEIEQCRKAEEENSATTNEIASLGRQVRGWEVLSEFYAKLPFHILDNVVGILEDQANKVLEQISDTGMRIEFRTEKANKSGKINDEIDIVVSDIAGERPIIQFSGGERTRLILAITVGLAEISSRKAGTKIETIFIDEPSGLDDAGFEDFSRVFRGLIEEFAYFKRGFVIGHDKRLKANFDQKILVAKHGLNSYVKVIV